MNHPSRNAPRHAAGFTLMEVLIAVLVLAVGLLGMAGLQTQALRYNHSAYLRSQAVQLTYDMADRLRANLPAFANADYEYGTYDCAVGNLPADPGCIQTAPNGCTSAQLAQYDFRLWNQTIRDQLPGGCGLVTQPTADLAEISVSWVEQVDLNGDGAPDQQTFLLRFEP